ncbi:hypothetical protein BGY98DRAFT_883170, partial [Russula aff. rugulosa BPL654]
ITDRLSKDWNAPIYAFFHPVPSIDYVGNPSRRIHVFECNAKSCKGKGFNRRHVRRYLDTADGTSTSNLRRHAKICWGEEAVAAADAAKLHGAAREVVEKSLGMPDGSITAMFERIKGNGIVTYSHKQHTKAEARYALDYFPCFVCLMKTGRPGYYIPSPETVSRDTKKVFARCRKRIAKMLQNHKGKLSFATDAWTSPNHKAYVAVTVHFEQDGAPISMLLDLVHV